MPRLEPAPGYVTAKEAQRLLEVSDATLYRYVVEGKLKRYWPPERKHKFYKLTEIEAVKAARNVFVPEYRPGDWRVNPSTVFEPASPKDMPIIVDMDHRIFAEDEPVEEEWYARWQRKNPETFFVIRDQAQMIKAYACFLPVERQTLDKYLNGEIDIDVITEDKIDLWRPGKPLHVYVMAMGVDPACSGSEKHEYGARLINGLFSFLLELGEHGVEIETISARSFLSDGIRLLRKMGIPQLRSPVPGKRLFSVHVPESGFDILVQYSELLEHWKQEHQEEK